MTNRKDCSKRQYMPCNRQGFLLLNGSRIRNAERKFKTDKSDTVCHIYK